MSSIEPTSSSYIISETNYTYPAQLPPLSVQIPINAQSYTVTPPESTASGGGNARGYRIEDVGRLSDMEEEGTKESDIKEEVVILDDEETPAPSTAPTDVQMVNVRPNGKITPWDGNSNISKVHPSSLKYMKEVMKDILGNITSPGNINELIVLQGANGGVPIHRSVITHYSKIVQDQVDKYPDCSSVVLPNYSVKVLRRLVTLLYEGECFFSEEEKKTVNLVWEVMRFLRIKFNGESFFCHPFEFIGVKQEVDDPKDTSKTIMDMVEVDQTDETWYEDYQVVNSEQGYDYMKIIRVPHPEKPGKLCSIQSSYGTGVRILRGVPAMAHINGDEIQAEAAQKDKEETKKLLEQNKIMIVNLSDDEEEEDGCPTPNKKSRTQTYPASTNILRDEEFKKLFASGKVNLNMLKEATANCKKPDDAVPGTSAVIIHAPAQQNYPSCSPPAPFVDHGDPLGDTVISAKIPANNPARTGITIIQPSASPVPEDDLIKDEEISPPPSPTSTGMPVLQLATGTEPEPQPQVPKRRTVHAKSLDITEGPIPSLPTLDRMMVDQDDGDNQDTLRENAFFPDEANSSTLMLPTMPTPAAIIPKARVNNFVSNRQIPCASARVVSQIEDGVGVTGQRTPKSRRHKALEPPSPDIVETTAEMREAYAKEEELKNKCYIVASKKIPVPDDMKEDNIHFYVENMDQNQNDDEIISNLPPESQAILNRHGAISGTQLVANAPATGGRIGKRNASERGTGRGRGRPPKTANLNSSYPDVTMTEVETGSQTNVSDSDQPGSSRQTRLARNRGGGGGAGRKSSRGESWGK